MTSGKRLSMKKLAALLMAALLIASLAGCGSLRVIREDSVREELPEIDPEAGVSGKLDVKLYYRLAEEEYLVAIPYTMDVISSKRAERGIVEALLEGAALDNEDALTGAALTGAAQAGAAQAGAALTGAAQAVVPEGTELVDISLDGSILYITLSSEFVATDIVDAAAVKLGPLLNEGSITKDDYYVGIMEATSEMYARRRLGAISIINSVTEYNPAVEVQLLIDSDGNGVGERLRRTELGFVKLSSADTELIEPMRFSEVAVATPKTVLHAALDRLIAGEYEKACPLFDVSALGDEADAAALKEAVTSCGAITGYELREPEDDEDMMAVEADIDATDAEGALFERKGVKLELVMREGVYAIELSEFIKAVWGE